MGAKSNTPARFIITAQMSLLTISNLRHTYGTHVVLDGATLSIEAGEKVGLVGRNGSGKTTLLNRVAAKDINGFPKEINCYFVRHEIAAAPGTSVLEFMAAAVDKVDQPGGAYSC